jgi:DUF971 family protein
MACDRAPRPRRLAQGARAHVDNIATADPAGQAVSVDDRFQPSDVLVERDKGVTITFLDGYIARFDLVTLRQGCPCATCRTLRERGEVVWPRSGSPAPLRIDDARHHGAWGLNITWNDRHATGIFPFEWLRRWHEGDVSAASAG